MVTPKYHTKQLKGKRSSVNDAEPLKGGGGEGSKGETTSRGSKGPEAGARHIVFKIVLLISTTKDAGKQWGFIHSVRSGPGVYDGFQEAGPKGGRGLLDIHT
tara:strand:+ start:159 stop:464 length:306 start_codon:yes stop_codon:yes gene_type:complete